MDYHRQILVWKCDLYDSKEIMLNNDALSNWICGKWATMTKLADNARSKHNLDSEQGSKYCKNQKVSKHAGESCWYTKGKQKDHPNFVINESQVLWICQLNLLFCTLKASLEIIYKEQTFAVVMRYVNLRFQSYLFGNEALPHLRLLLLPRHFGVSLDAGRRIEWA